MKNTRNEGMRPQKADGVMDTDPTDTTIRTGVEVPVGKDGKVDTLNRKSQGDESRKAQIDKETSQDTKLGLGLGAAAGLGAILGSN